ncbi:hypothetical protein RDI58_015858 [Solanum bulbocastanum]|uniref:C2 domain-containing protein n=1 Tax=Solanum bulbocastanum TaxID=147425 RepID=A0AAN8YFE2_SOLBU
MDFSLRNFTRSRRSMNNFYYNNNNWEEVYVMKILIEKAWSIILANDTFPYSTNIYRVIVNDESGREFKTSRGIGTPAPVWNEVIEICFKKYPVNEELKLMVVRENCYNDPGTSTGEKVVGRATIIVPDVQCKREGVIELVKLDGVENRVKGFISYQILLTKVRRHYTNID